MKPDALLEALEEVARQVSLRVRYEPLPPGGLLAGGGLCRVRGEWQLIVDKKATPSERVAILLDALAGFDTEAASMTPKVREALAARRASKPSAA